MLYQVYQVGYEGHQHGGRVYSTALAATYRYSAPALGESDLIETYPLFRTRFAAPVNRVCSIEGQSHQY